MAQLYESNYIRINSRIRASIMKLSILSEISTLRSTWYVIPDILLIERSKSGHLGVGNRQYIHYIQHKVLRVLRINLHEIVTPLRIEDDLPRSYFLVTAYIKYTSKRRPFENHAISHPCCVFQLDPN